MCLLKNSSCWAFLQIFSLGLFLFLTGHVQYCKVNNVLSKPRNVDLSIIQGSGFGPSLYVIMECDLQPRSWQNILIKYADDTNLLDPEHTDCQLDEEFGHIQNWALKIE